MNAPLDFDAASHTYTKEGVMVPGVTRLLQEIIDYSTVGKDVLDAAAKRGTAVHLATELYDQDDLDDESVHPVVRPYLDAWVKFRDDTGFIPTAIEETVFSKRHWYAGKLDRRGPSPDNGDHAVFDIKTTAQLMPSTGPQLAAYQEAKNYRNSNKILRRYAVQLKKDGTYRLKEYDDDADFTVFLSCKTIYTWRLNYGH